MVASILIFTATYAVIAAGRIPGLHLDRTGAALLGASLMLATGALSLEDAYRAVDFDTIALLLGMMIVVANLRLSGFFRLVTARATSLASRPVTLLVAVILVSGLLSAVLVNDTICLVLTPLVLELVRPLRRDPIPYLLAVAMASNVGSVATITGNPQNMLIGSFSRIPYDRFAATLAPVAAIGLALTAVLIVLAYWREFVTRERLPQSGESVRVDWPLMLKVVAVALTMIVAFFLGAPAATVSLIGGSALLLTRRVKAEEVYREIDWPLLLMFAGLFIVVAGFERSVLTRSTMDLLAGLPLADVPALSAITVVLSNVVSNVPAVLVLKPFIAALADPNRAWLTVAMAATLAGNLTLVGSVANLIVAQRARAHGVDIGFWTYLKVGAPLTLLSVAAGVLVLSMR